MSGISLTNNSGVIMPVSPDIEFLRGNDAVAVPPNATTHILELIASTVANGTNAIPVSVINSAPNTENIEVQVATAAASSDINNAGLASFDSSEFAVDANGFVTLADVLKDTAQTIDAVTANVITIPLAGTPGVYQFEARVKGFDAATPSAGGYNVYATVRTTGVAATVVGNENVFNEDLTFTDADAYFIASGNSAILQVLGVAGLTIDWTAETEIT